MKTIQERLQEHYDEVLTMFPEEQVFFVALQGSQNYGLDDEESDVDTKAVLLPSLDSILFNKDAVSRTHVRANEEHIDLKDIRLMFQQYRKQNINFTETLFSKYVIVNPMYQEYWDILQAHREQIARYNPVQCMKTMCGMVAEKYHALTHRYPSRAYYIDTYGYDGKQLSHELRVLEFMYQYINGYSYEECLIPFSSKKLLDIKRHQIVYTPEEAQHIGEHTLQLAKQYKDKMEKQLEDENDSFVDEVLDTVQKEILCEYLKTQLDNI